ncbi:MULTISPECIES: tRNA lysidine(34) synthetase TilS [Laceyella]|uniref:tRNA(Ile)-lysidine synthase n=1 Tax=Laceyella sediminis TaxID=573074 RepID=A0ABX5EPB7_9BACL|nr:tRNA lysidine(34) synthetase TilS [Laceyella sediminis]MRG27007.1 tRNA lysidine(34) synthetase TilS [Laceyella tengchongensis]PRZ13240.1 tRNA(Ile)-lysidine synthase [Laceyella sediminis]
MFLAQLREELNRMGLAGRRARVLVGVSGGADSIALVHALKKIEQEVDIFVAAVHVNHQLRGEESEADEQHVKAFCEEWRIPCRTVRVNVGSLLEQKGGNKQAVARELRYDAFEEMARAWRMDAVATAHHADDQLETVLMRLVRGTGVAGLAGIEPIRAWRGFQLIRPLLTFTKQELERYCQDAGLPTRLDSSNLLPDYTRNRLRMEVVPLLEAFNPHVQKAVCTLSDLVREEEKVWSELVEDALGKVLLERDDASFTLDVSSFLHLPIALQRRVVKLILSYLSQDDTFGVSLDAVEKVRKLVADGSSSSMFHLPGGIVAEREYEKVHMRKAERGEEHATQSGEIALSVPGTTCLPGFLGKIEVLESDVALHNVDLGRNAVVFDRDHLPFPLCVRARQSGDRMTCLGMDGRKKLKKVLMEAKVPKRQRDRVPVVTAGDEIIWIPGVKRSGVAPVTPNTTRFLYLIWEE